MRETNFPRALDFILTNKFHIPAQAANLLIANHIAQVDEADSIRQVCGQYPDSSPTTIREACFYLSDPHTTTENWSGWRKDTEAFTFKPPTTDLCHRSPPPSPDMSPAPPASPPAPQTPKDPIEDFIAKTKIVLKDKDPDVSTHTNLSGAKGGKKPTHELSNCFSLVFPGQESRDKKLYLYVVKNLKPVEDKFITVKTVEGWMREVGNHLKEHLAGVSAENMFDTIRSFYTDSKFGRTSKSHFTFDKPLQNASVLSYAAWMSKLTKKDTPSTPPPKGGQSARRNGTGKRSAPEPEGKHSAASPDKVPATPPKKSRASPAAPPPAPDHSSAAKTRAVIDHAYEGSATSRQGKVLKYELCTGSRESPSKNLFRAWVGTEDFSVRFNIEMASGFERSGGLKAESLDEDAIHKEVEFALGALKRVGAFKHAKDEWFPPSPPQCVDDFEGFD